MHGSVEVVFVPVSDPDRAMTFWVDRLGFRLDQGTVVGSGQRYVQVNPGGVRQLARVRHRHLPDGAWGAGRRDDRRGRRRGGQGGAARGGRGPDEDRRQPWGRFVHFADPDGDPFWLQEPESS
jgi:catechol 2,3-dioxygenase-like lactoylglutathione lyase family enzyme